MEIACICPELWPLAPEDALSLANKSEHVLLRHLSELADEEGLEISFSYLLNSGQAVASTGWQDVSNHPYGGYLLLDLSDEIKQRITGAGLEALGDRLTEAMDQGVPVLGFGSGFNLLTWLALRPVCDLEDTNVQVYWPENVPAGREAGEEQTRFCPDPDREFPLADWALRLDHRGERDLHPAIQGRIYRAKWCYPFASQSELYPDAISRVDSELVLAYIARPVLRAGERLAVCQAFLQRAASREAER